LLFQLQGYSIIAPIDSFGLRYMYTATLQTFNIPLQANLHFLNTSRVSLYTGAGINATYALSQHSHLTLIKEHSNTDIFYNKVTVNRFNAMLTLGLGCDIRLYKRFYFTLAPYYRYALNNQSATSGITFKPSYFSANGGFRIKF
jgi:hypothetical protein